MPHQRHELHGTVCRLVAKCRDERRRRPLRPASFCGVQICGGRTKTEGLGRSVHRTKLRLRRPACLGALRFAAARKRAAAERQHNWVVHAALPYASWHHTPHQDGPFSLFCRMYDTNKVYEYTTPSILVSLEGL
jgi:hypothetical protein